MRQPEDPRKRLPRDGPVTPDVEVATSTYPEPDSRARWLFEFLRLDLDALDTPAWQCLRREAWDFIDDGASVVEIDNAVGMSGRLDQPDVDSGALRELQDQIRRGIQNVQDGRWWVVDGPTQVGIARWRKVARKGHRVGGFRTLFLAVTLDLLEAYWSQMRACPRCGGWFLRRGKQAFCSEACSRKSRWARFAANRPERDYRAERERALRKRLGKRVKVGRKKIT